MALYETYHDQHKQKIKKGGKNKMISFFNWSLIRQTSDKLFNTFDDIEIISNATRNWLSEIEYYEYASVQLIFQEKFSTAVDNLNLTK